MDQTQKDLNDVILRLNRRHWGIAAGLLLGFGRIHGAISIFSR